MLKVLHTTSLFFFLVIESVAQIPIDVAESTFKLGGLKEEEFYYGFAEGDQLTFNFSEVNGKELKEVEIIELPSSSKFMDYKTKTIVNKTIVINRSGIYKFRFSNSAISGRVCKYKIQRIPSGEETKNFNTNVFWKTLYDTTYRTIQERYLVRKEFKAVSIVPISDFYVNSGSNAVFKGGKSRITIPVTLPANTQEWYYTFSASRNKIDIDKAKSSFNLVGQLSKLVSGTSVLNIGIDMLTKPPGGNVCDVFQLDFTNRSLFEAKQQHQYFLEGTRLNISSGVSKITGGANQTFYIGIRNPDEYYGIDIAIEVVAIVLEEEWSIRDVQKINVSSSQEAYLKN